MQISSQSSQLKNDDTDREDGSSFLLSSEKSYQTLVANIPGAVYRCSCDFDDPQGFVKWTIGFLSEAIEEISGYPSSDFINDRVRSFASIIHPEDRSRVEETVSKSIAAKWPYILEYRIVRADGRICWVYEKGQAVGGQPEERQGGLLSAVVSVSPISSSQSEAIYLHGVILDITERKRLETELSRLALVAKKNQNGVVITDAEGCIEWVNEAFTRISGYAIAEIQGQKPGDVLKVSKQIR